MATDIVTTPAPTVLVALKPGPGARAALSAGSALANQMLAAVAAVHVGIADGAAEAWFVAAAAGVHLTVVKGPVLAALVSQASRPGIVALVLAGRSQPGSRRPHGRLPLAVGAAINRPVLIVPAECRVPVLFRRLLLPVDERRAPSAAILLVRQLVRDKSIGVVLLHVQGTDSIPAFDDQPHHEGRAWERRFRRQVGASMTEMPLQVRVGTTDETVLRVAKEAAADLIVLEWAGELGPGRAPVVRRLVGRTPVPVLLVRSSGRVRPRAVLIA